MKEIKDKKIFITGGHLTPAVAIIQEFKTYPDLFGTRLKAIYIMDGRLKIEEETIKRLGVKFYKIKTGKIPRYFSMQAFFSLFLFPLGFFQGLWLILKEKPDLILSFGSYIALPVCFAGWLMDIPVFIHEQTIKPGLANKIIAHFARKIFVSWPQTLEYFPENKTILSGNPLRKEIRKTADKKQITDKKMIYIIGGGQGSQTINQVIWQCLPELLKKYRIIHQTGSGKRKTENGGWRKNYVAKPYFWEKEHAGILNKADLVISRSGANTVTELAALGKPAILIPLPWAGQNEQMENAELLKKAGTALILPQEKLNKKTLFDFISLMLKNQHKYQQNSLKARRLINPHAAKKIISEITKYLTLALTN